MSGHAADAEKIVRELTRDDVAGYVYRATQDEHVGPLEVLLWALVLEVRRLSSEIRELRVGDVGGDR